MREIMQVIDKLKGNSPGYDYICNSFLKNLPREYVEQMQKIFNNIWESGHIPKAWKTSLVVLIHKFGKSEQLVDSFWPISLLPCVSKVMEKIVKNRLYWWMEKNDKLSKTQGGFRNRLNTIYQVGGVESQVRVALVKKEVWLVVFIDLKSAYDNR